MPEALELYHQGQTEEAKKLFLKILRGQPDHPEANFFLGLLALDEQQAEESLHYFEAALEARPEHGPYWLGYIEALAQAGQEDAARELLLSAHRAGLEGREVENLAARLCLSLAPSDAQNSEHAADSPSAVAPQPDGIPPLSPADMDTIIALYQEGRLADCEHYCRKIISAHAGHGFSWKVLGAVLKLQGRTEEAIVAMQQAVTLLPHDPETFNNLGLTLENAGRLAESETTLRQALQLDPNFAEAHNNLGVTLRDLGRLKESEQCFRRALELQPSYAEASCNLGITLKDQGQLLAAKEQLEHALQCNPSSTEAYNTLGNVFLGVGLLSDSEAALRKAIELKPDFAVAYNNLGNTLHSEGRLEESVGCYLKSLELDQGYVEAFDGLLFVANNLPDITEAELRDLYREYDRRFGAAPSLPAPQVYSNSTESHRVLRLGYVSPSLYNHPVVNFLEPLLQHHDKSRFEIFVYSDTVREDQVTARYKSQVQHWLSTIGFSDQDMVERIRRDRIDILVDLAGHTGRNRLKVFAAKPSPVSLHWLDFGFTTGLSSIDYYLTDSDCVPIGSEQLFSERPWRLPCPAIVYRPKDGMGEVGALPAASRGYVTFGTLTRAIRINHRTLRVWAQILQRLENSRLVINSGSFKDGTARERLLAQFAELGISAERLEIGYSSPPWDVLRTIDISLDCFPHNSGTTLFESLYMGVPFITLADRPGVGRMGCSVLRGVGHPEWIAWTEDEYIEKAVALALDGQRLAAIRSQLRAEIEHSPLMDEQGFTGKVEDGYAQMFGLWCEEITARRITGKKKAEPLPAAAIDNYNKAIDLQQQGVLEQAKDHYLAAINLNPGFAEAYNNLGTVYQHLLRFNEAEATFLHLLTFKPDYVDACFNLGNCFKDQHKSYQAEKYYRKAIELRPDYVDAHYQLGNLLQERGMHSESETALRRALALKPDHINVFSTLLFALNYHPDKSAEEIFREYQEFNTRYFASMRQSWQPHTNTRQPDRRLRIGYVAPDYRKHPARHFLTPLLEHHDRKICEIFAFIELPPEERASDLFAPHADHWFATRSMSDEQLARLISEQAIDILVDLAGHTAHNRLGVFARKPAPVSLHWLDFAYTTGLTAIDYYLGDTASLPTGCEHLFSERPWRLTPPALAYRPPVDTGPAGPLPAIQNDYITFGTLTRAVRLNHRTIRVWSEILKKCPGSRLIVNSGSFAEPEAQQMLRNRFTAQGIEADRLDIGCTSPPWEVLRKMDIGLDCFPHNSGTTLVESLYMGVPYVTLADRPSVGRLGSSILTGVGHPEWIARSEQEYIELALRLADNPEHLVSVRQTLRQEMEASPMMDEQGFARKMEQAFRQMFQAWCSAETAAEAHEAPAPASGKVENTMARRPALPAPPSAEIRKLTTLYDRGNHAEALKLAKSLTSRFPEHGFGWKVLGPLLFGRGEKAEALAAMERAARYLPEDPEAHYNLGIACQQAGRLAEAEAGYRRTLSLNDGHIQARFNLANILKNDGRLSEAEQCYRQIIQHSPNAFEPFGNLGNVLKALHRPAEAADCYRAALAIKADSAELLSNLGLVLAELGDFQQAEEQCTEALRIQPTLTEGHTNLGLVYQKTGRLGLAEASFRYAIELAPRYAIAWNNLGLCLQQQGRLQESEQCYDQALSCAPDFTDVLLNRGILFQKQGNLAGADESYRRALAAEPDNVKVLNNLAVNLLKQGNLSLAEAACRKALELDPNYAEACTNLSNILSRRGYLEEAERYLRKALELKPESITAHSNLLFVLNYHPDRSGQEIYKEYQRFNDRFGLPLQSEILPHNNSRDSERRLRIGYVAPQLRHHSARHFLEPLFAHHDKSQVEVYAYAELYREDQQTMRYRSFTDHWISTTGMSDKELAARIRADNIDVLIDLAGHTDGNRLQVFARKPAPVSLHWLDFGYTTGLTAIDYYLTDEATVPAGSEELFSETPWRMETPCLVYRPAETMGSVSPLPAAQKNYVTFGTLTRAIRINHRTIRVWTAILRRVPDSHLVIDSGDFADAALKKEIEDKFVAHGIDRERLEIGCHTPPWDLLRTIDIGFDCFPHNSGTTLFEMLYMGIPYVTLTNRPSIGTLGGAILQGLGHPEWIARTEDEYVDLAVALAANLPGLSALRAGLRQEMSKSPLMDEPAFARKVEWAYREIFRRWCKDEVKTPQQLTAPADSPNSLPSLLEEAARLMSAGELTQARELCAAILQAEPRNPEANYRMGCVEAALKRPVESLSFFETALEARPETGKYWTAYIDALDRAGRRDAAVELLEMAFNSGLDGSEAEELRARFTASEGGKAGPAAPRNADSAAKELIALFQQGDYTATAARARLLVEQYPENGLFWKALGLSLAHLNRQEDAVPALGRALDFAPDDFELYRDLATILDTLGRWNEVADIRRRALLLKPADSSMLYGLANCLVELGLPEEAEKYYILAIEAQDDLAEAYFNLGNLYRAANRIDEARGRYLEAIERKPDYYKAYCNLGIVLQMEGRLNEAETQYRRSLNINPEFVEAHVNLGACLKDQGRYKEAEQSYKNALALQPDMALCLSNLGSVLKEQGRIPEAEQALRQALVLMPDYAEAYSNLLFLLNYHPDKSGEEIFTDYREFNQRFCTAQPMLHQEFDNEAPVGRRLRIGYVSPQFRRHSTRHFLEPLLARHDRNLFEIYAYAELTNEDEVTGRYRSHVDHWLTTVGLTDQQLAERIRADRIDILVDLAGHTAHNRLKMFAVKPAPVSLHWLDFGYTTGLTAIDYYLTDPVTAPEGSDSLFSEKPWRMPTPSIVYRPDQGMGEAGPLPALERGYVTFGTLTRAVRLNHRTIRVWSEILRRVPGSRLVIDSNNFRCKEMQQDMAALFATYGIGAERLLIGYHSPPWDVLRGLDISLDCFPHNSGTTLFETLYMGVPYITLANRPGIGRLGASLLSGLGHPEWIAETEEHYVDLAVQLATDIEGLSAIRAALRREMQHSPLMDEASFARKVESAYGAMFAHWFNSSKPNAAAPPAGQPLNHGSLPGKSGKKDKRTQRKKHAIPPKGPNPEETQQLIALFQQGRMADAASLANDLLLRFPEHSHSWKVLGAVYRQQGNLQAALQAMETASRFAPRDAVGLRNIAVILTELGKPAEAESSCRKAIALQGDYTDAYATLGIALRSQHKLDEAEQSYRKALRLRPDSPEILVNLGLVLNEKKQYDEAEKCYRKTLTRHPEFAEAFCGLSITLTATGHTDEAESAARQALALKPGFPAAYNALGTVMDNQGRYEEAASAYRQALSFKPDHLESLRNLGRTLHQLDRHEEAAAVYRQALQAGPDNADCHYNLGNTLLTLGKNDEAEHTFRRALALQPDYPEACLNLGNALRLQGWITEAETCFRTALRLRPDYDKAYNNLGSILQEQGRLQEAEEILRAIITSQPDFVDPMGNLLFLLNYHPDKSGEEIYAEYRDFNERFCLPLHHLWQPHTNDRSPGRRLKIGYISPQFRQHPVCNFLEPLLAHHDKNQVEIYAYADLRKEDRVTERYRSYVDHWLPIRNVNDSDLAERIRADRIDILVDLAGHTEHNRLLLFARKPAPVSLHWLDFGYTTGLTAIDYYLTDEASAPVGSEHLFAEKTWRIDLPALVYRPTEGMGEISGLPAKSNGYVTFACLSRAVRINYRTIRVWSAILRRVAGSRLVVNSGSFKDPAMRERLVKSFLEHGIEADRLDIGYSSPPWDILRSVDIGFDCFPHNSGTTLVENLYMGVPFITLADRPSVGRLGSSLLHGVGQPELIARSEEEYIEIAAALAHDLKRLVRLRGGLRRKMAVGPLMDEAGFARKVEAAYRQMFGIWCKEQQ